MDGFTYPGLGPAAANPWAFPQQQPGMQQQAPQQPQFSAAGAAASLGALPGGAPQPMPMLPGLMQQHMQQVQQQQQQQQQGAAGGGAAAWGGMHGFQLPANFMPSGLGLPDGGAMASGYPSLSAAASPLGQGGQHLAYSAMCGQGGMPGQVFGGGQQQQQQAMLHQQAYGGQLHSGLPRGQVPLHALHAGGVPPGFMPQPHYGGGGGGGTMVPSAMVQSGVVPDPTPSPCGKDGGLQAPSPPQRHSAERREVAKSAVRLSIPPGGVKPRPASAAAADGGRRRSVQIEPHGWAGQVVWAKLAKYPWWPAQVLEGDDPYIPAGSEAPRRGAVPVRFFGTYDFSWIESQRMLQPFQEGFADKSRQPDEDGFAASVQEAQEFLESGALPEGFELALLEQDDDVAPPAAAAPKPAATPAKRKAATAGDGVAPKARSRSRAAAKPQARKRDPAATEERLQHIRRSMALEAPAESPFADAPCLDGLQQLVGQA